MVQLTQRRVPAIRRPLPTPVTQGTNWWGPTSGCVTVMVTGLDRPHSVCLEVGNITEASLHGVMVISKPTYHVNQGSCVLSPASPVVHVPFVPYYSFNSKIGKIWVLLENLAHMEGQLVFLIETLCHYI